MTDLAVTLLIVAGFAAAIVGHQMERHPAFLASHRLPDGLRLPPSAAFGIGAALRLSGIVTLVAIGGMLVFRG